MAPHRAAGTTTANAYCEGGSWVERSALERLERCERKLSCTVLSRDFFAGVDFTTWPALLSYYRVLIALRLPASLIKYGGAAQLRSRVMKDLKVVFPRYSCPERLLAAVIY